MSSSRALPRRGFLAGGTTALLLLLVCVGAACKSATQITLDVRTNVDCSNPASFRGVAVYVGKPGLDVESRAPTLVTTACQPSGEIGTVVIAPSGAKDEEVGIRVVAGLLHNSEDCAPLGYQGCIVARRAVRFDPAQNVAVVVDLQAECTSVACDSSRTCVNGACVDARQVNVDIASTNPDAASPDGASAGGGKVDGASVPTVRCGDDGLRCATSGDVCCLHIDLAANKTTGKCMPGGACPSADATLYCDDSSQCNSGASDGGGSVCCAVARLPSACQFNGAQSSGSQCTSIADCGNGGAAANLALCDQRQPCPGGSICNAMGPNTFNGGGIPGYFACCL